MRYSVILRVDLRGRRAEFKRNYPVMKTLFCLQPNSQTRLAELLIWTLTCIEEFDSFNLFAHKMEGRSSVTPMEFEYENKGGQVDPNSPWLTNTSRRLESFNSKTCMTPAFIRQLQH